MQSHKMKNMDRKYTHNETYEERKLRRESIETASKIKKTGDYEDYLESLDLYDRKKVKKRKDPFKDVPEIVESEQEIFGRKYWSWLFRQSLYSLCSGPLIHLSCFISGMPEISKERIRSKCGAAVALVAWILLGGGGGMSLFYYNHGREIAALAGVLHNHKLIEGISTMDAYKANALMAYGMRGFLGWLIILTVIFAFIGKKVYFNSFLFGKFELRQEADQSMPEDTTKKQVHLTKKERKRYERIHQKLQDNNGDRAIRHDEDDQFLAAVSKSLAYMHDDEDDDTDEYPETKSPATAEPAKTDKRNKDEKYDDIDLSKIEIADKPTGFKRPDVSKISSENGSHAEEIQKEKRMPAASRMETKKTAADQEQTDADSCRWQVKMIDDTRYWICSCGTKEKYYDIENQKFCPYCGKKITF